MLAYGRIRQSLTALVSRSSGNSSSNPGTWCLNTFLAPSVRVGKRCRLFLFLVFLSCISWLYLKKDFKKLGKVLFLNLYQNFMLGWVGLWGLLWWAPSAKRKDHHGVSSGCSSVWHSSNTGLSSTQYEQIPIILGVWPFWLTPFFFRPITFWWAYG